MTGGLLRLLPLLPPAVSGEIERAAQNIPDFCLRLFEIRLRTGRYGTLVVGGKNEPLRAVLSEKEAETLLCDLCGGSVYAHRESLAEGYVDFGEGIRVGIAGRAVLEAGTVRGLCEPSSFCIRIPHEVRGAGKAAYSAFLSLPPGKGMLVFSPPGGGKTTLLRDLARYLSCGRDARRTVLVDSRGELAFPPAPHGALLDILSGYPRAEGILIALRVLSPEVLIFDEIASQKEGDAVFLAAGSGVPVITSVHAGTYREATEKAVTGPLIRKGVFGALCGIRKDLESFVYDIYKTEEQDDDL